jgi:hypothetical protein
MRGCREGAVERTLAFFLEREFTLLVVVLVLSTTTILTTLFVVLSDSSPSQGHAVAMERGLTFPLFLGILTGYSIQTVLGL